MRGVGPFGSFQTGTLASFIGVQWAIVVGAAVTLVMLIGAALRVPELRAFGRGDESERDRPVATGRAEPAVTAH